ncbi:MAG: Single-stranded DNA-binding protein [Candidatus Erwinia impunctatus]|nr:Single-stranded DNA-binding protein [Culicoides impunctatus]
MTAQISAYGRLVADPQQKETSTGKLMAMARMAVSLPCRNAPEGDATMWLSVVAFGQQAETLAKHIKGDMVSIAGNMQLNQWTAQDGTVREQLQVIADSVISARTTRPGARKATSKSSSAPDMPPAPPPFDDDVPF